VPSRLKSALLFCERRRAGVVLVPVRRLIVRCQHD
jgi:hypothetical protein